MLLKDFLKESIDALERLYPPQEARNMVLLLCESRIGTKSYTHIVEPGYLVPDKALDGLMDDVRRLSGGEPLQYVTGVADFYGEQFNVSPSVLVPRPETEILCREAIKDASRIKRMRSAFGKASKPVRVLDLCTGSGCIAWTLALNVPGSEVIGVDLSDEALAVASAQPFASKLKEQGTPVPKFLHADVLDCEQPFDQGEFDLIVSNPPYIMDKEKAQMRPNVLEHEPAMALFVPDDDPLVFYRAVAVWARRFLAPGGKCMVEINELLGKETDKVFADAHFPQREIVRDMADKSRFIICSMRA